VQNVQLQHNWKYQIYQFSVNSINDLDDDDEVILEGYLMKKTGKEEYLFKDKTGEIKVEVDDKKLRGMTVTPETLIRIKGEVDNDWFSIQIDVDSVEIMQFFLSRQFQAYTSVPFTTPCL
jgi:uncharacterized protein (TIGR00156 family)